MSKSDADGGRIDDDHRESSPSTGWKETAWINHVTPGRGDCDALECDRDADPVRVVDSTGAIVREGERCSGHAKHFLEVST